MFRKIDWRKVSAAMVMGLWLLMSSWGAIAPPAMAIGFTNPFSKTPQLAPRGTQPSAPKQKATPVTSKMTEVPPPVALRELGQAFEANKPQVRITSPRAGEVLTTDTVSVQFQVRDLTLFKNKDLGLGPHLHVFLDNQPYQAIYDATKPLILENLAPGTHTIRAFASRPWHESFKNEGAYAQTTFHVYAKTQDNSPDPALPVLTYSRPQASYGAEPIMLDFYLTNAPLHLVAREAKQDDVADWRIRCTINGSSFLMDEWQPIYLKGFKPGKNWVQLEFLDEAGNLVKNSFNNTVRVINYEPGGNDTLAKLVRGELTAAQARGLVDPNYKPPVPQPSPTPTPSPVEAPVVQPSPSPSPSIAPSPSPTPTVKPSPLVPAIAPSPMPTPIPTPSPVVTPSPVPSPAQSPTAQPQPTAAPEAPAIAPSPVVPPSTSAPSEAIEKLQTKVTGWFQRLRSPQPSSDPAADTAPPTRPVAPSQPTVEIAPTVAPTETPQSAEVPKQEPDAPKPSAAVRPTPVISPTVPPGLPPRDRPTPAPVSAATPTVSAPDGPTETIDNQPGRSPEPRTLPETIPTTLEAE